MKEFANRIVGMMADYKITMREALLWEYECVLGKNTNELNPLLAEFSFVNFLDSNGINNPGDVKFYTDIFMQRANDMELTIAKTETK